MTPERRQEIEGLLARPIGHTSQREVSTLRKAVKELLAENATLKGEVERLRKALAESAGAEVKAYDKLDALVTAGTLAARALENIVDKKVGEWDDWETAMRESYPEYLRDIRGQAKQGLDALAAAVREAKGRG